MSHDITMYKDKLIEYRDNALKLYELRSSSYEYEDLEDKFSNRFEDAQRAKLNKSITEEGVEKAARALLEKGYIEDTRFLDKLDEFQYSEFMIRLLGEEFRVLKKDKYNNLFRLNELFKNRPPSQSTNILSAKQTNLFSEVSLTYIKEQSVSRKWTLKTKEKNEKALNLALNILGDKELDAYKRDDFSTMRDILMKLPPNLSKMSKFKGMSYSKIASLKHKTFLADATVNKTLSIVSDFFNWAILQQYCDVNFSQGLKIKQKVKKIDQKLPLADEDFPKITKHLYHDTNAILQTHPERIWILLIGLYQGMRLEEISQLHIKDIYEENGIWVFDINTKRNYTNGIEKRLKNIISERVIPIHPALIKLGFIEYFQSIQKIKGNEQVWSKLNYSEKHGFGRNIGDWFNKSLNTILDIKDLDKKSFHSTRHTFAQKSRESKMDLSIFKAMFGHAEQGSTSDYGKAFTPQQMMEELVKVQYPILEIFFGELLG